ncbi:MAG: hypothetical protein L6R38_007649 [Xanthoria sp. 2 TBL-2021]|nr:MAG: hypothetical protein L6R38_007649 [Xanthoria sp. 2 TBL-2021]
MALSPTTHNVRSVQVCRKINDTEQLDSSSRFVHHTVAEYAAYPGHGTSTSDLPFRTIEWGQGNGVTSSSTTARLISPFEEYYRRSPAYAPTPICPTTDPYSATPRFIAPFTASALPSCVRSPAAPTHAKRRSESCFSDVAPPSIKVKKEEDEDIAKPIPSPPLLTERRASAANERHHRRNSQHFESWRKKRKDQKMRLQLDAVRYEAEQEALFNAHRERHGPASPMAGNGEKAIKQEHGEEG